MCFCPNDVCKDKQILRGKIRKEFGRFMLPGRTNWHYTCNHKIVGNVVREHNSLIWFIFDIIGILNKDNFNVTEYEMQRLIENSNREGFAAIFKSDSAARQQYYSAIKSLRNHKMIDYSALRLTDHGKKIFDDRYDNDLVIVKEEEYHDLQFSKAMNLVAQRNRDIRDRKKILESFRGQQSCQQNSIEYSVAPEPMRVLPWRGESWQLRNLESCN
jgi:hypothetical protein